MLQIVLLYVPETPPLTRINCTTAINVVRPPYDTMFDNLTFQVPQTAVAAYHKQPALPKWVSGIDVPPPLDAASEFIMNMESDESRQRSYRNIISNLHCIYEHS